MTVRVLCLALGCAGTISLSAAQTPPYQTIRVSTFGTFGSYVNDLNSSGVAIGTSYDDSIDGYRNFSTRSDGTLQELTPYDGSSSIPMGINDRGQIALWRIESSVSRGFFWDAGRLTDLGGLGGTYTEPRGVAEDGAVVGGASDETGSVRPFLWRGGSMTALPTLANRFGGQASQINSSGVAVGFVKDQNQRRLPAIWSNGALTSISDTSEGEFVDINASGTAIGNIGTGFTYRDGKIQKIYGPTGQETLLTGINDCGDIVGVYFVPERRVGFLLRDGVMTDLWTMTDYVPPDEWKLTATGDIANSGHVAMHVPGSGGTASYILRPVPEPGSMAVLGLGLAAFRSRRRRSR